MRPGRPAGLLHRDEIVDGGLGEIHLDLRMTLAFDAERHSDAERDGAGELAAEGQAPARPRRLVEGQENRKLARRGGGLAQLDGGGRAAEPCFPRRFREPRL